MKGAFTDHFSRDSQAYAKFRPRYPEPLFRWLAGLPAGRRVAWDGGTGSGQAATMLAAHFERVMASDASSAQLQAAEWHPGVHYFAGTAESSAIRSGTVDLVTVAQAFHWLDQPRFYAEVSRIITPGGALAVWCYATLIAGPEIDAVITRFYGETVGPYWPYERIHVDRGYLHFQMPIDEVPMPPMAIQGTLSLPTLLGYIHTWSAVGRYIAANGHDPVEELRHQLGAVWGDPQTPRPITWPISMRAGRWSG